MIILRASYTCSYGSFLLFNRLITHYLGSFSIFNRIIEFFIVFKRLFFLSIGILLLFVSRLYLLGNIWGLSQTFSPFALHISDLSILSIFWLNNLHFLFAYASACVAPFPIFRNRIRTVEHLYRYYLRINFIPDFELLLSKIVHTAAALHVLHSRNLFKSR